MHASAVFFVFIFEKEHLELFNALCKHFNTNNVEAKILDDKYILCKVCPCTLHLVNQIMKDFSNGCKGKIDFI